MKTKKYLLISFTLFGCAVLGIAQQDKPGSPPGPSVQPNDFSPQNWKEYSSIEGRFKVLFPGTPKDISEAFEGSSGNLVLHVVMYVSAITYSVVYVDYPMNFESPEHVKTLLDGARNGSLQRVAKEEPRIIKEFDILVDGHPGRFLHVELKGDAIVRVKYVLVGNRMYVVTVGTPKANPKDVDARSKYEKVAISFLDSFKTIPALEADISATWKEFSSAEGGFRILFPGTPQQFSWKVPLRSKESLMHISSYQSSALYSAMYVDYPEIPKDPIALKNLMDDIRIGEFEMAAEMKSNPKVLNETDISLDGYPGRFLVAELFDNRIYRRKMVIVKSRIYIITATAPRDDPKTTTGKTSYEELSMKFINSFSLTAKPVKGIRSQNRTRRELRSESLNRDWPPRLRLICDCPR